MVASGSNAETRLAHSGSQANTFRLALAGTLANASSQPNTHARRLGLEIMGTMSSEGHHVLQGDGVVGVIETVSTLVRVLQTQSREVGPGPGQHHVGFFQLLIVEVITMGFLEVHPAIAGTDRPLRGKAVDSGGIPALVVI